MRLKKCNKCNIDKELSEFNKLWSSPDGHSYCCKICHSIKEKLYRFFKNTGIKKEVDYSEGLEPVNKFLKDAKQDKFIKKSQLIRQNPDGTPIYNYDRVNFVGDKIPVIITCSIHGDFSQTPNNHLSGQGCPKCFGKFKRGTDEFIKIAQIIHKNPDGTSIYNYDKVNYINSQTLVIINCSIHGDFNQLPNKMIRGIGCPLCGIKIRNDKKLKSTDEFIKDSQMVHQNLDGTPKYIYNKVNYTKSDELVTITCPEHGDFNQKPNGHLSGRGCPSCSESKGEKLIQQILREMGFTNFKSQHSYKDCKNSLTGAKYVFDIYLPYNENNFRINKHIPKTGVIFEYDGIQHFKSIDFYGGEERFNQQIHRDYEKNLYCKSNKIKLVRIPYTSDTIEDIRFDIESSLNNPSTFILTGNYLKIN
jgi:hypothetical protein